MIPEIKNGRFVKDYTGKTIKGVFDCTSEELISLKGAPRKTGGFECSYNYLTSLKDAPEIVDGFFSCCDNPLSIGALLIGLLHIQITGTIFSDYNNDLINKWYKSGPHKKIVMIFTEKWI